MAFYYFYIPNIITKSLALCMQRLWSLTVLKLFFDNQRVFADVILYGSVVEYASNRQGPSHELSKLLYIGAVVESTGFGSMCVGLHS